MDAKGIQQVYRCFSSRPRIGNYTESTPRRCKYVQRTLLGRTKNGRRLRLP